MIKNRILVLGAGLAGLSTAWHLQNKGRPCLLFEKEGEPGGLCRSKNVQGFTFDYCGHLLHFKNRYINNFVKRLLKNNLIGHEKNAWIYSHKRFSRYPFQANLYGLPEPVIKECLLGFLQASRNGRYKNNGSSSFLDWINHTFGRGIAENFMIPYNHKFWTVHPRELTRDWLGGFIPVPSLKNIVYGTVQENKAPFGYNARFWYPKTGGIQEVARRLSSQIKNIHTLHEVGSIDLAKKEISFTNGRLMRYDILISTLPLPEMLNLLNRIPAKIAHSLRVLKYTSIFNLNLGIKRKNISDKHWIYFPEKDCIFFRCGFPENFSSSVIPKNMSSIYVEVAYSKNKTLNKETASKMILESLKRSGIIKSQDKIIVEDVNDIKYGYIIYDRARSKALKAINKFFRRQHIFNIGRYGSWSYMSMEDCLLEGKAIAETI